MKRFYPLLLMLTCASLLAAQPPPAQQPTPSSAAGSDGKEAAAPYDPLLDVPPLPKGKATLVGGTVHRIDHIRYRMEVRPFGGGRLQVRFDERTRIFRDEVETTALGVQRGDRVYVDTMLVDHKVFAKNIRVRTGAPEADARGQLLTFDSGRGAFTMRDRLSAQPVRILLGPETVIRQGENPASTTLLQPGALIAVRYSKQPREYPVAREVIIHAVPGRSYYFAGRVTHLDLRSGLLALENRTDNKIYDLYFDRETAGVDSSLQVGSEVAIEAKFAGDNYTATGITVRAPPEE